jgi:C4-dicarboxylate-specific signal transduction histidine kinase
MRHEQIEPEVVEAEAMLAVGIADAMLLEAIAACQDLAAHQYITEYYAENKKYPPRHRILTTLRRTVARLNAVGAYLLEEDGIVVTSTDPGAVNQQFGDWFSFADAMKSSHNVLPTISVAKRRRGFVISAPVLDKHQKITGVVASSTMAMSLSGHSITAVRLRLSSFATGTQLPPMIKDAPFQLLPL